MKRERMSLPNDAVLVADYDGAQRKGDGTMVLSDGSQLEIEYRNGRLAISLPDGTCLEGKAEVDGTIRMNVLVAPDGTRHECNIVF